MTWKWKRWNIRKNNGRVVPQPPPSLVIELSPHLHFEFSERRSLVLCISDSSASCTLHCIVLGEACKYSLMINQRRQGEHPCNWSGQSNWEGSEMNISTWGLRWFLRILKYGWAYSLAPTSSVYFQMFLIFWLKNNLVIRSKNSFKGVSYCKTQMKALKN